jgi:hypothetical protein
MEMVNGHAAAECLWNVNSAILASAQEAQSSDLKNLIVVYAVPHTQVYPFFPCSAELLNTRAVSCTRVSGMCGSVSLQPSRTGGAGELTWIVPGRTVRPD